MYHLALLVLVKILGSLTFPISNAWGEWQRKHRSESWPPIPGQVRAAQLTGSEQKWGLYSASIFYGYSVNGENYPGSFELHFPWKFLGDRYISRLTPGLAITVRYNPSNPDESVFRMDDQYALISRAG
jgi:hypothetical protein